MNERDTGQIILVKQINIHVHSVNHGYYIGNTPASNLGYLAPPPPPGQFFMGAKLFIGTPLDGKRRCPQKNWFGLCEIAWFLCRPIANFRRGVCL